MIYIEYLASILTLSSLWLISKKRYSGWVISLISCFLWIYISNVKNMYGLFAVQIGIGLISIKSLISWRKSGKKIN